jgi:heterogeneous nuclear rnp K-like protein 2
MDPTSGISVDNVGEKRSRDDGFEFQEQSDKKPKPMYASGEGVYETNQFTLKFLIKKGLGGAIIGKGGANIKQLRENHTAKIDVTSGWDNHPDRLIALTGFRNDVLLAYYSLLDAIWTPNPNNGQDRAPSQTFRFLIPNTHMGAVIGKQGCNIGRLRAESGAAVRAEKQGGTVDRVVEAIGDQKQLQQCCELLVNILEFELPDKMLPVIPDARMVQPLHFETMEALQRMQILSNPYGQAAAASNPYAQAPLPSSHLTMAGMLGMGGGMMGGGMGGGMGGSVGGEPIKFSISQDAIGKVIGKGGANIKLMRMNSGANIQVDSNSKEVSITGTPEQKQIAFMLLTQSLNRESN